MTDSITHRGPEGDGFWISKNGRIGFGHRRLSIIDLSVAGHQPMHYLDRYTITYNGELYNYIELREALKKQGYQFITQTDTEVILAAFAHYKEECLQHFDGMFAFAIWDDQTQTLFCARDRFGEKPFYFYKDDHQFLFASEMKALWAAGIERQVDKSMIVQYISIGSTTNTGNQFGTFYSNIYKLPKAHYVKLSLNNTSGNPEWRYQFQSYWDIDKETVIDIKEEAAIEKLSALLTTSVKRRLRSDVPVGTSLSGGLDSSSIVAVMQQLLPGNSFQKSFSAVFPGFEKDEGPFINRVATQFKIENFTTSPGANDLINDLEKLIYHQEEPFQSSSIYAQYKVYELAKQHDITVLLDGQGADEILAGYHKYYHWYWQQLIAQSKWNLYKEEKVQALQMNANVAWTFKNYIAAYLPSITAKQLESKAVKQLRTFEYFHKDLLGSIKATAITKPVVDKLNDVLYFDTMQQGLEDLLRYADRNSMAHSREVRLPFLNHQLVEFIFSLPAEYKIKQGWTKWILRKAMQNALPKEIVWRKDKIGFEPPQKQWMLHPQMQELLHESKRILVDKNILKAEVLNKPISIQHAHEAGNYDWRFLCVAQCF